MNALQKLAAIKDICDQPTDDGGDGGDPQPKPKPSPDPTPVGYPSGGDLLHILATLNWNWNSNNGYSQIKLDGYALCGCNTDAPCNRWNIEVNATAEPNALLTAARWRRAGMPPGQIISQLAAENQTITLEQIAQLELVMQHYSLLPS